MKINPNSQIQYGKVQELPQDEEHNQKLIKEWLKKNKPSTTFKQENNIVWASEQKIKVETKQSVGGSYYRGS